MPTYQYACTACDHRLEAVQSFTDDPLTQCPVCAGRLRKQFSSVGIVFKGSGFYRNDSRAAERGNSSKDTGGKAAGKDTAGKETSSTSSSGEDSAGNTGKDSGSSAGSSTGTSAAKSTTSTPAPATAS